MHERSPKNTPLDTILYEIDMLRHCARTLAMKKIRAGESGSDQDWSEYYLGIEGFLLHLRNLLAFLTSRCDEPTDLGINAPDKWLDEPVDQREYSGMMKYAREINDKYGVDGSTCYDQISKFLQHCTTYRHEQGREWDIDGIFAELDPVLQEFEKKFAPAALTTNPDPKVIVLGGVSNSTATFRTCSVVVGPPRKKE
jgi:hypothetical protein